MAVDLKQIGNILGGIGASVQGRGMEFAQQQNQQRRQGVADARAGELFDLNKRQKGMEIEKARRETQFTDAFAALTLAKRGDKEGALRLGLNRRKDQAQFFPGSDTSDTDQMIQLAELWVGGDEEAGERFISTLEGVVDLGQELEVLPKAEGRKFLETKDGRATFLNVDGTISEEAVQGAIQNAPNKIKFSDFRAVNKDVGDLVKEPIKIRNAAARLQKIAKTKSPTDQLAAVFTFMKALDPTSVVREGEQDQARSTGGITDQFIGFIDKIRGEGALPAKVFEQMVETAQNLSNQASEDVRRQATNFLDAFGDRIKEEDKIKLLGRIPKIFKIDQATGLQTVQPIATGFKVLGVQ